MNKMKEFKLTETEDYVELRDFFIENELEVSEEEPVPTDAVKSWRLADENGESEKLVGGITLAKREGEFIIDGIAVDQAYRKHKLGGVLLDKAVDTVKSLSGERIYLVARAPGFFRTKGFETVPREEAPTFFECLTCPQYGVNCHPEVMKLDL